jgi:hypothetical protein
MSAPGGSRRVVDEQGVGFDPKETSQASLHTEMPAAHSMLQSYKWN